MGDLSLQIIPTSLCVEIELCKIILGVIPNVNTAKRNSAVIFCIKILVFKFETMLQNK